MLSDDDEEDDDDDEDGSEVESEEGNPDDPYNLAGYDDEEDAGNSLVDDFFSLSLFVKKS